MIIGVWFFVVGFGVFFGVGEYAFHFFEEQWSVVSVSAVL